MITFVVFLGLVHGGLVQGALAHGGEDHGAPAAPTVDIHADTVEVTASSSTFESVLRVARGPANTPVVTTLWLADFATSAPIADATPSLALSGPGTVQVDLAPTPAPGVYQGTATFPAVGDYAGALVVTTPAASDLLAIDGLHLAPPEAPGGGHAVAWALGGAAGVLLLGLVGLAGLGLGYLFGRRRAGAAAGALLAVVVGLAARRGWAHGGVDDEGPAPGAAAPAGGTLTLPMESQFLLGLRTTRVVSDRFEDQVEALGRFVARPGGSATLRAPVAGIVVAPPTGFPHPGTAVHAGDTLAILREVPGTADRAALAEQRTAAVTHVAEAKRALALGERDAAHLDELGDSLSAREQLDRRQAVEVARVGLREAEAALDALTHGATVAIRAPVDGRLGKGEAQPGDQVEPGTPLFRVTAATGLWLEARVPERLAVGLRDGATAVVTSPALPDQPLPAVLLDAGQEADPATGMVTITLAVEGAGSAGASPESLGLRPGMGATAWIARGAARDAVVVPAAAVIDSNGTHVAFVKIGPERFEARELALGGRSGTTWEVRAGIRPTERVVVAGTYPLRSLAGR
jgi:RND family efflux transporter MFP subunit